MKKSNVITVCTNCLKVHKTPKEFNEDLIAVNFCPDCEQEMDDFPEIIYYKKYMPKELKYYGKTS